MKCKKPLFFSSVFFFASKHTSPRQKKGYIIYIFQVVWKLSGYLSSCLEVVWKLSVPEYILTLKNKGYCLSTVLVRRGCSHTLNRLKTLNSFVETLFSPDIFGLTSSFFLSCGFSTNIFPNKYPLLRVPFRYESFSE